MAIGSNAQERQRPRHGQLGTTFTLYFVVFWTVLSTFNFGFGTSELNPLQNVLSCPTSKGSTPTSSLPTCISLSSSQFGYITAAFTVGGFLASLALSPLKNHFFLLRRSRNVLLLAAIWNILGGLVQMVAASWQILAFGRFVMGLGSGIAVAVVPSYLNDISPPHLKGSIGVLNQLSIVLGILCAQALGVSSLAQTPLRPVPLSKRFDFSNAPWRYVPLISSAFALLQVLLAPFALDSPSDLDGEARSRVQRKLWGNSTALQVSDDSYLDESEALLGQSEADADTSSDSSTTPSGVDASSSAASSTSSSQSILTISDLLKMVVRPSKRSLPVHVSPREGNSIREGALLIIFTQMAQQLSGVNAVLYFSTGILSDVFQGPDQSQVDGDKIAKQIGLGITLVNTLMTFPPIPLIKETLLGRKRLLQISSATMSISALILSFALLTSKSILAAISIVFFVAGFSLGLGPIPFLILPELVPKKAIPAASSLGISLNWLSNITVASLFLPLKNTFAGLDGSKGGSIFLIFVIINAVSFAGITRFYSYR